MYTSVKKELYLKYIKIVLNSGSKLQRLVSMMHNLRA